VEVYGFLFTDMLLLCKVTGRKASERYKIIRQPFMVDRVMLFDTVRDGQPAVIVLYLSDYQTPVAYVVLCSNDKTISIKVDTFLSI
jgi:hypothetical protein